MQSHLKIGERRIEGAVVLELSGELDVASTPRLEQALEAAADSAPAAIVLDLRKLEFMDSTGLRAVLIAHEAARAAGTRFGLVRGTPQVQRLLALTQVAERLAIVDEPEELAAAR